MSGKCNWPALRKKATACHPFLVTSLRVCGAVSIPAASFYSWYKSHLMCVKLVAWRGRRRSRREDEMSSSVHVIHTNSHTLFEPISRCNLRKKISDTHFRNTLCSLTGEHEDDDDDQDCNNTCCLIHVMNHSAQSVGWGAYFVQWIKPFQLQERACFVMFRDLLLSMPVFIIISFCAKLSFCFASLLLCLPSLLNKRRVG